MKDLVAAVGKWTLKQILITAGIVLLLYWVVPAAWLQVFETEQSKYYREEFKRLTDWLALSQTESFDDGKLFERRLNEKVTEEMRHILDSLEKEGKEPVAITEMDGILTVFGEGETVPDPRTLNPVYKDAWLDAEVIPDYEMRHYWIRYNFTFRLKEISVQLQERNGKQGELFSVFIESTRDPGRIQYFGDLWRERIALIQEDTLPVDMQRWYWSDWSFNLDFVYSNELEAGLSISPFTWTAGGLSPDAVIMRLPEVGVSTNLEESHHLFVGARVNIGHWLPVFSDLYISSKYGIPLGGSNRVFLIGLGTTL